MTSTGTIKGSSPDTGTPYTVSVYFKLDGKYHSARFFTFSGTDKDEHKCYVWSKKTQMNAEELEIDWVFNADEVARKQKIIDGIEIPV